MEKHSSPIAEYLFTTFTHFVEHDACHPADRPVTANSARKLEQAVNELAQFLAHGDTFRLPENGGLTTRFAENLRDFVNQLNRSPNPLNMGGEHKRLIGTPEYCRAMAAFYDSINTFLNESGIAVERHSGEPLLLASEGTPPVLLKRMVSRDSTGERRVELLPVGEMDFSRKAVLCLGGTSNLQGNGKISAGLMQLAEDTLGGEAACRDEQVDLYCIAYPTMHRAKFFRDTYAYNADPEHFVSPEAQLVFDSFMKPGLQDGEGRLLPARGLKKQAAKFNFFAYSQGTVFVQELRNAMAAFLLDHNVPPGEVRSILANAYSMNLGNLARLDADKAAGHFSALHILSETDLSVMNKSANLELVKGGASRMIPLRENEIVIRAHPPAQGVVLPQYNEEKPEKSQVDGLGYSSNPSGHGVSYYALPVAGADGSVHNPRYVGFSLPDALQMHSAFRHLDPTLLPPRPPAIPFVQTEGGRISSYSSAVIHETAHKLDKS